MKTILLISELGGGLGHVAPLIAIGNKILNSDFGGSNARIILATTDSVGYRDIYRDLSFALMNAPATEPAVELEAHSASFTEVLATFGYSRPSILSAAVKSWDDFYTITNADLIIADYSPTACLAARGKIPVVQIGTGFTMPPTDISRFPALRSGYAPPTIERNILQTVNSVLESRGQSVLDALPKFLETEFRAIFTLPQLDPYGPIRNEPLLGSYHVGLKPLDEPEEPLVFLYAGRDPTQLDQIVQSATLAGYRLAAYLGPMETASSILLKNRGAIVYQRPPPLSDVLSKASIVVSHGGAGLTNAALTVGRPQILLPLFVESDLTCNAVEKIGSGIVLKGKQSQKLGDALSEIIDTKRYTENAQAEAHKIAAFKLPGDPVGLVADAAIKLIS